VAQAVLYGFFGAALTGLGWSVGWLYIQGQGAELPLGTAVWLLVLLIAPPIIVAAFVARPVRMVHRCVWAVTAVVGTVGLLRGWSVVGAVSAAAVVAGVLPIPRKRWSWT
jgi:hypothetical protein